MKKYTRNFPIVNHKSIILPTENQHYPPSLLEFGIIDIWASDTIKNIFGEYNGIFSIWEEKCNAWSTS